jgi:hypothetical protein
MIRNKLKPNRVRITVFALAMLLLTHLTPLAIVQAGTEAPYETGKAPYFPGLPDNTVQYNKTDVTPLAQMDKIKAGEPALFYYRNITMLMNCTKNCDIVFTADPSVAPKIFGFSIDPSQTMKLTMNLSGSPLEGAQTMERTLNFYFGIEPNATLQLSAQLRLHINQTELSQQLNREVNASRLTWMFWNGTRGEWEAVDSYMDQNGYLVCDTDHFSAWTVAEIDNAEEALQFGLNIAYVYAAITVVIAVVLAVGIVAIKKHS